MVIQAEVGHSPQLEILVLLDAGVPLFDHVSNIVDKGDVLTSLAIGIDHQGLIRALRITLLLNVPLLLTVAADNVGVPRAIAVFGIFAGFSVTSLVLLGGGAIA